MTNEQEKKEAFWDTSDTVFENYDEHVTLNTSNLRNDKHNGFDNNAGNSWIYPTNYPVRKYQHDIVYNALFKNTLVVLPTGLGKTFIAAVVMYNFYRWYPQGKVIFMAPTKPLVSQQIEACFRIMGISKEDTAEITGRQKKEYRAERWRLRRVFYGTPQSVISDFKDTNFPMESIKLVVIDEAHKAKGNFAYCNVIRMLTTKNKMFRVLALSATPGSKTEDVAEVVTNLLISHIEMRTEKCPDVAAHVYKKQIETKVVRLNNRIQNYRDELIRIIDPYVQNLITYDVIAGSTNSLSKAWLLWQKRKYDLHSNVQRHPHHSEVITNFNSCIMLYHALELLERHGLWSFIQYFDSDKFVVAKNYELKQFLNSVRHDVGAYPFAAGAIDNLILPIDFDFGHPKFYELQECLLKDLNGTDKNQAIVFCEFRETAFLIHQLLLRERPDIRPAIFIGQGSTGGNNLKGITQKQQIETMANFRRGVYNVLIATCVAEEGIDCGDVNLIVCFDVASKNPIRLVQRMGRTGRKRNGRVILLVTEGREQKNLKETLAAKDDVNKKIVMCPEVTNCLLRSPRLIPTEFNPKCIEMFIQTDEVFTPNVSETMRKDTDNHSEDIRIATPKRLKKQLPTKSSDLRNFFQPVPSELAFSTSQIENIFDKKCLRSFTKSRQTAESLDDRLKIPTFWDIIHNDTTPSIMKVFAVKKNVHLWRDKFVNKTLSDVDHATILKIMNGADKVENLMSSNTQLNTMKRLNVIELDVQDKKYDSVFVSKLNQRVKQITKEQEIYDPVYSPEKKLLTGRSNYDVKIEESQTNEIIVGIAESIYKPPKSPNRSIFINTPMKPKQTSLKSSTPLYSRKKKVANVKNSPLMRAFEKSVNKSREKKAKKFTLSEALTFLGLKDVLDVFDSDEDVAPTDCAQDIMKTLLKSEIPVDSLNNVENLEGASITNPLEAQKNKESQEYTISQILKILNETQDAQQEANEKRAKTLDIGNLDDIFADDILLSDEDIDKLGGSNESDVIASSQSVITNVKLPCKMKKNCELTHVDDMFASFSTTNSPTILNLNVMSPSSIKKTDCHDISSKCSYLNPIKSNLELKETTCLKVPAEVSASLFLAANIVEVMKSPTTRTNNVMKLVQRSPSMFNRKINLSRLSSFTSSSNSEVGRSKNLKLKSPLFNSCVNLGVNDNLRKNGQTSKSVELNDNYSQIDATFKIHRNPNKRNRVINDTILNSPMEKKIFNVPESKENIFKKPKKLRRKCAFVQDECDASDGSSDEIEDTSDVGLSSLICNDEVHEDGSVDMKAVYLQSVKSPVRRNGFKLPRRKMYLNDTNIFSQTILPDDSVYDASFVVDECDENDGSDHEMSVLERAERILKSKNKKRKMPNNNMKPKRRKIIVYDDSSDEDI